MVRGTVAMPAPATSKGQLFVGITGSLASGKSTVLKVFKSRGFQVLNADTLVHEIYRELGLTREAILKRYPPTKKGFRELERFIHPRVLRKIRQALAKARAPMAVEIPLLFEVGADALFSTTVFVYAPKALRSRRAIERGMSQALFDFLESKQWPSSRKRRAADCVLNNRGDKAALQRDARSLATKLLRNFAKV